MSVHFLWAITSSIATQFKIWTVILKVVSLPIYTLGQLIVCVVFSDITVPSTSGSDGGDGGDDSQLSTSAVAGITFSITLLVSFPVGVAVGMCLLWCIWRRCSDGSGGEREKEKQQNQLQGANAAIYEEPASVETAIPLSDNLAYGQISTQQSSRN